MKWFLIIMKLLTGSVSFFGIMFFVLVCISGVVNPQIEMKNGEPQNSTFRVAILVAIVTAVLFTIFLIIP